MSNVYGRRDFAIIGELIVPRTRVLDLGCGEGELLAWLKENKQVDGRGVEMEGARVQKAIARGASVYQGDLESAVEDYPDQAFDYVVLSQTLQETRYPLAVLRGMLRVGKRAIVAFPNFGHYSVRLAWLLSGRARGQNGSLMTGTIHQTSTSCRYSISRRSEKQGWNVERRICVAGERQVTWLPNLMAEIAVFEVSAGSH